MPRIAFTAKPATSRTPIKISFGFRPRVAAVPITRLCDLPRRAPSRYRHRRPVKLIAFAPRGTFLRGARKKAILGATFGGPRVIHGQPPHWSIARDVFELRPLHCRQRARRLSGGR